MPWNRFAFVAFAAFAIPLTLVGPVIHVQADQQTATFVNAEPVKAASQKGAHLGNAHRVKAASNRGALLVRVVAEDEVRSAAVVVDGPRGYLERVTETTRLSRLRPGAYRIKPRFVESPGGTTTVRRTDNRVRVRAGRTAKVKVVFRWSDGQDDPPQKDGPGVDLTAWEADVVRLTNDARSKSQNCGSEGRFGPVPALRADGKLTLAARRHAKDMAEHDYFDHESRDGRDVGDRLADAGYRWSWWGENIAAGQESPAEVVDAWLDSDGHCANLMTRQFTEIGVGLARGGDYGKYWVQDFARPR